MLSTDLYSFKSAKQRDSGGGSSGGVGTRSYTRGGAGAGSGGLSAAELPPSVRPVAHSANTPNMSADDIAEEPVLSGAPAGGALAPVDANEMLAAVEGILSKVSVVDILCAWLTHRCVWVRTRLCMHAFCRTIPTR